MKSAFLAALAPAVVAGALSLTAIPAHAVPVSCPGTPGTGHREFTLDTTPAATCFDHGTGNLTGNPLNDVFLNGAGSGLDLVLIDKTDDTTPGAVSVTGVNGSSGTWSFSAGFDPSDYARLFLGLKSGNGQLDPDWAVFELDPSTTGGSWQISSQGLSHMNLYGQVAAVPLPASVFLLLFGLAGLGFLDWRRRAGVA